MTLYASSKDKALTLSRSFHGAPRAGEAGEDLVVVEPVETVDVSSVSGSHIYIGDNGWVLDDLRAVLHGESRGERFQRTRGSLVYWVLE
jgi:esterase/lipase superfamily enzyme